MQLREAMEDFKLDEIPFRAEQIGRVEEVFKNYKKFQVAPNLILTGVTGSGKTFCLQKLLLRYPGEHIFISASKKKRSNQILSLISGEDIRRVDTILEKTIERIKKEKKIIIIDELNKLEDLKTFFDDINTIYRETEVPIILITNNPLLIETMPEDARLTLFFEKVGFKPYDAHQLGEICQRIVSRLPPELIKGMGEATISLICARAAKSGSARRAIDLLRKCILNQRFDESEIDSLIEKEEYLNLETF